MQLQSVSLDTAALNLIINAEIDFDSFNQFAELLAHKLDCQVQDRQWGADRHQWLLYFEGSRVLLNYEACSDSCWLAVESEAGVEVLAYLATLLKSYL